MKFFAARPGLSVFMKFSPTKKPLYPMAFNFLIEATSLIPLSETFTNSAGISSAKDRLV